VFFTEASNLGWGALHEGMPASGLWSRNEKMKAVGLTHENLSLKLQGSPRISPHRQHVRSGLQKSPGGSQLHAMT